jgi:prephenate dehydrogenase
MHIAIIGLGLIGGSLALDLRANGFASLLTGVDQNPEHLRVAQNSGIVDRVAGLAESCADADLVILAVPVQALPELLPKTLDLIRPDAVVTDMGSTKELIMKSVESHPKRGRYVPAHPMAGTEYSGPQAAIPNLFNRKAAIICDPDQSDSDALETVIRLFKSLFMRILYMGAAEHDMHAAYVSHISHISSFVLAMTVLEKEKSERNIFELASGGFASTVRLAKSSPEIWSGIYEQNSKHISEVLESYIRKMEVFKEAIDKGDTQATFRMMEAANEIRQILHKPKN